MTAPATPLILLAAYNGESFIGRQIESIQAQRIRGWQLLIRDDGSSDKTPRVIRAAAAADPRIELLGEPAERLGVVGNFSALLSAAVERDAEYVMFSDQDDVWLDNKLDAQLAQLRELEAAFGRDVPCLVHSDLTVVDQNLRPIRSSFMAHQRIAHEPVSPLPTLLVQNFVTGCTVAINAALARLASPIPHEAIVHDWWLALCAAATGAIGFLPRATVLYRQHADNQIGARRGWRSWLPGTTQFRARYDRSRSAFAASIAQAGALESRLRERRPDAKAAIELATAYRRLFDPAIGARERWRQASSLKTAPQSAAKRLVFRLRMAAWRPVPGNGVACT